MTLGANAYDARGATEKLVFVPGRPGNILPAEGVPWEWGTVASGETKPLPLPDWGATAW